jgi:hypothetical protein
MSKIIICKLQLDSGKRLASQGRQSGHVCGSFPLHSKYFQIPSTERHIIRRPILTLLVDHCVLFLCTLLTAPPSLLLSLSRINHRLTSLIYSIILPIAAIIRRSFLTSYLVSFLQVFCQSSRQPFDRFAFCSFSWLQCLPQ